MLDKIIAAKKKRLSQIDTVRGSDNFVRAIEAMPKSFGFSKKIATNREISIIAEIKRRSPSKGLLKNPLDIAEIVTSYESAGATAISVLTEEDYFDGSIDDLINARKTASVPILRKDFILEDYQVYESRAIGADAILLIARILTSDELSHLCYTASQIGLDVLIEVHDQNDLEKAVTPCPHMIGINNRNLETFETDIKQFEGLVGNVPYGILTVAESGIFTREDIKYLEKWGADAALIGESIITSESPYDKIAELRGVRL